MVAQERVRKNLDSLATLLQWITDVQQATPLPEEAEAAVCFLRNILAEQRYVIEKELAWKQRQGSPDRNGYVYALVDPRNNMIRYVGISTDPWQRLNSHMGGQTGTPEMTAWTQELKARGLKPIIQDLEVCQHNLQEAEQRWIRECLKAGEPLFNTLR